MAFIKRQIKEFYLSNTNVENIFIHEYMASAPGDYVKVYLLSLMYSDLGKDLDNGDIAKHLAMDEEDVLKAWTYWEGLGTVKKKYLDPNDKFHYDIEFLNLKELLYGSKSKRNKADASSEQHPLSNQELKAMYRSIERIIGRLLGGKEPTEILSWITDYKASPEVILFAYSYCAKTRKKDNHKYVGAVVKEWMEKQLNEVSAIDTYLQEIDRRHFLYKRVLKSLGFTRNATEEEKRLMDTWFDEMEFPIEKALEACNKTSGIPNPNINYVNRILRNWYEGKDAATSSGGKTDSKKALSIATVQRYYDMIRKQAETAADERKKQIYQRLPEIKEIDDTLRSCGMEISRLMISTNPDKKQKIDQFKNKVSQLSEQKNKLLCSNGFEPDYMETKYRCRICKDSGTNDEGDRCKCFQEIQNEAELWQKT